MTSANPSFTIERRRHELRFRVVTLVERDLLAPDYVRVRLHGEDLAGFDSPGADDHMRLFFPEEIPATIDELRAAPSREYTPVAWGDDWLEVEFALHGHDGVAAGWAATAPLGSRIGVGGPRGSAILTGDPGAWLLVGDATAIPAIRRFAARIGDAPARILIEVRDAAGEIPLETPVEIEWVYRGDAPEGSALTARLDEMKDAPCEHPFVFIAAEQAVVKPGRALLERWGVPAEQAIVKGYWKRGEAEYHAPH